MNPSEMSFEELRARYDAALTTVTSLSAALIEKRAPYDEQIAAIETKWLLENAELIKEEEAAAREAKEAETVLRDAIVTAYRHDPSTKQVAPHLALSVQARKEVVITNKEKLAEWLETHPDFMIPAAPDIKTIKEAAKDPKMRTALKMEPFIAITEKPTAVIGKLVSGPDGKTAEPSRNKEGENVTNS
jgi:hypothetical protein